MAVLRAVIDEYVETCAPVGSKSIVDNYGLGVSSATVRGDLSRLEDTGHLIQPHVSSGRVPTDLGYRAVVDEELTTRRVPAAMRSHLRAGSLAEALRGIAVALADMTRCLAIVSAPVSQSAAVARITLTRTQAGSAVLVVVLDDGRVENRIVSCPLLSDEELSGIESELQDAFVGKEVDVARTRLDHLTDEADVLMTSLMRQVHSLVFRPAGAPSACAGVSFLLRQPELVDDEASRSAVDALESGDVDFARQLSSAREGLVIRIGRENPDTRLGRLSFVAQEFWSGTGMGFVACVGPRRMDYRSSIAAVGAAAAEAGSVYAGIEG